MQTWIGSMVCYVWGYAFRWKEDVTNAGAIELFQIRFRLVRMQSKTKMVETDGLWNEGASIYNSNSLTCLK